MLRISWKTVLKRLRKRIWKALGLRKSELEHRNLQERFTYVYRTNAWESAESASGPGSTRDSACVHQAIKVLSQMIEERDIRSIADVPCGDFNWMPLLLQAHPRLTYRGYDIVAPLVAANRATYPGYDFERLDITRKSPSRSDLIFSKDLINHLTNDDAWKALANMFKSGAEILVITSNGETSPNVDLPKNIGGMSRALNLRAEPFNFPAPLYDDGYLAVWEMANLSFLLERR
ncbi:MAG: class I SAM-dependent methyltransferase [Proteobacteria bacterium]|nr:class I SAM-dependent methyltransferase [Pseudomonadota bacterium]